MQQIINNGESGLSVRTKINDNFTELYEDKVDKTTTINDKELSGNITLDKSDIGLSEVDNTSDLNKPISNDTQEALDLKLEHISSGLTSLPVIIDNNDGTLTIGVATCNLYDNSDFKGVIKNYNLLSSTISFTDGSEEYIGVRLSGETAEYYKETDPLGMNGSNSFLVTAVWRQGLTLHTSDQGLMGDGLPNKLNSRLLLTEPYKLSIYGGLVCSETITPNPRTVIITSGLVFKGTSSEIVSSFDSSIDLLTKAIKTTLGWTYSQTMVYDNNHINPYAGNESTMTGNKWKYNLYYRSIGDVKETFYIESPEEYSSESAARTASEIGRTDLPVLIQHHCMLVGRSIIQNGATSGITEQFTNRVGNFTSPIPNHNDTSNKQGGVEGEYYHQTLVQNKAIAQDGNLIAPKTSGSGIKLDPDSPTFGYKDLIGYINVDTSAQNAASLATFNGGSIRRYAFGSGDKVDLEFHIPHDYNPGSDLFIHYHWSHNGTAISGNIVGTFVHSYSNGYGRGIFTAEKTITATYNTTNISTTPRFVHRIEEVPLSTPGGSATLLDSNLIEVDGIIGINFTMTTIPTITGGSPNEPFVFFIDIHYQSTQMSTKTKNYPFYS